MIRSVLLLVFTLVPTTVAVVRERGILTEFFLATGGKTGRFAANSTWVNATNWVTDAPVCSWYGISCVPESLDTVNHGRIEQIMLPNNGLIGSIPPNLYQLLNLKNLILRDNHIHDAGFQGLAPPTGANYAMAPLEHVDFTKCLLTSIHGIGYAANTMVNLKLDRNQLRYGFPKVLHIFHKLQTLSLTGNPLGSTIPTNIGELSDLHHVFLDAVQFTGTIPTEIGMLHKLKTLEISANSLNGTIPTQIDQLVNLVHLNLAGSTTTPHSDQSSRLTGPVPTLAQATRLQTVRMSHQHLTGRIPDNFADAAATRPPAGRLAQAVLLDLSYNQLTGTLPDALSRFDKLNIELMGNPGLVSPVPPSWCAPTKGRWMNSNVARYGCDAILCPAHTYNANGQQQTARQPCVPCPLNVDHDDLSSSSSSLGNTQCQENVALSGPGPTVRVLARVYVALDGRSGQWHNADGWQILDEILDHSGGLDTVDWSGIEYCQTFHGILCDGQGRVQVLNLANNGLRGTIPARLFQLPGLESLDLSYNRVQVDAVGGFEGIGAAKTLARLKLSHTDVDTLKGIGQAANALQELFLDGSDFQGSLPGELFGLSNLKSLHLEASYLEGTVPPEIRQLSQLSKLTLNENRFRGSIPSELAQLKHLQYLDLSDNDFGGALPSAFNNMNSLLSLRINRARGGLGGKLLSFKGLTSIEELELSFNAFSGPLPSDFLAGRKSQQPLVVKLAGNKITGGIPSALQSLSKVTLELENNMITELPAELCKHANWMNGEVGKVKNGCNAILCPKGTWSPSGRASTRLGVACQECQGNQYFGETTCETSGLQSNREVEILDKLFVATGGRYWNASHTNWTKPGVPLCYREGVFCGWPTEDMNWGVTELRLKKFGLRGQVPTEIYQLPRLRVIDLSSNEINLSFDGVEKATILEVVKLSNTNLRTLQGFERAGNVLYELQAEGNEIEGTFPANLLQTPSLRRLFIAKNKFSGPIPTQIGTMVNLTKLSIHSNDLTGSLPTEIGSLEKLEVLDAHECKLSGLLPSELGKLAKLTRASLYRQRSDRKFTGPLFAFNTNPLLRNLFLSRNKLQGPIPPNFLSACDRNAAIAIDLSYNEISGSIPIELASFEKLNLDVVANEIDKLAPELCSKLDWMDGVVGLVPQQYRCDAIMCPPGTALKTGRLMDAQSKCDPCVSNDQAPYFGSLSCLNRDSQVDREILIEFYKHTEGDRWLSSENWLSERHVCSWFGVSCDAMYRVVGLKLVNNRLTNASSDVGIISILSRLRLLKVGRNFAAEALDRTGVSPLFHNVAGTGSQRKHAHVGLDGDPRRVVSGGFATGGYRTVITGRSWTPSSSSESACP